MSSDAERAYGLMRDHVIGTGLQVIEHFAQNGKIEKPRRRRHRAG
jgi:hypothetical protein